MKIIDLLNKIANGEEVPHFIIDEQEYYVGADGFLKELFGDDVEWTLDSKWLNEEVEILDDEEEKGLPNKLDYCEENTLMNRCKENSYLTREEMILLDSNFKFLCDKYNEIIDYLEKQR